MTPDFLRAFLSPARVSKVTAETRFAYYSAES
jgi:hypothetical protein